MNTGFSLIRVSYNPIICARYGFWHPCNTFGNKYNNRNEPEMKETCCMKHLEYVALWQKSNALSRVVIRVDKQDVIYGDVQDEKWVYQKCRISKQ